MTKDIKRTARMFTLTATASAIIGLAGCATTGDLDTTRTDLQSQIDNLRSEVSSAQSEAAAANSKANEAVNIANEANRRSMDTETKIDRMFKKTMEK